MAGNELVQVRPCAPRLREKFDQAMAAHDDDPTAGFSDRAAGAIAGSARMDKQPESTVCGTDRSERVDVSALDVCAVALRLNEDPLATMGQLAIHTAIAGVAEISHHPHVVVFDGSEDQLFERERVNRAEIAQGTSEAILLRGDR